MLRPIRTGLPLSIVLLACQPRPITLRVALYPYVPDARALFFEAEAAFEASHPGVNLELVETGADYYSGGLVAADADLYEIDSVLLSDMLSAGKLMAVRPPADRFLPGVLEVNTVDGALWAIPHWVCGNFLFFERGDTSIASAGSWPELVGAMAGDDALLIDLKGTSTLGEWYATALGSLGLAPSDILGRLGQPDLEPTAVALLAGSLEACPEGSCRNELYHDRPGYYARRFAQGDARAYVGYSESLYYAIHEISDDCADGSPSCRRTEDIAVRALPANGDGAQLGWVDAFGLDADLDATTTRLALEFVDFMTSVEGYRLILRPEWGESPRYLMPATALDTTTLREFAPLYPSIFEAYSDRTFLFGDGLNEQLRARGRRLDCALPGADVDCQTTR